VSVITSGFYYVHDGGPTKHSYVFDRDSGFYYAARTDYALRDGRWEISDSRRLFETRDFKDAVARYEALIAAEPTAKHSSTIRGGSAL
jgi:hypothetical protein